jgi:UDP-N-acetylmuramate dehydrogenase
MLSAPDIIQDLSSVAGLTVVRNAPLNERTRFGIGGPAGVWVEAADESGFVEALRSVDAGGWPCEVIGSGTNLIVSDSGFEGVVLRSTDSELRAEGGVVFAAAGASLQDLVDFTVARGLAGLETLTGIPGTVGAAVYGNAGAYGRSISGAVREVRFFDGRRIDALDNSQCEFGYRDSVFKHNKRWVILSATLQLEAGDTSQLHEKAAGILDVRNRKYPPTMKCAGSIFKNLLLAELPEAVRVRVPERVVIEGKVPSAWFLDQAGAKGMAEGDIRVADYHANLIYNEGHGTAAQLRRIIDELKRRVHHQFGFVLEEEVQYIGF